MLCVILKRLSLLTSHWEVVLKEVLSLLIINSIFIRQRLHGFNLVFRAGALDGAWPLISLALALSHRQLLP